MNENNGKELDKIETKEEKQKILFLICFLR